MQPYVVNWSLRSLIAACFSLASFMVSAEEVKAQAPVLTDASVTGNLLQTTLGLLLVLALIGAAAWAVKRFGNINVGAHGRMKILGGISVGTRERVVLLEVGEQQLLLGVAPGRVQTLHVLDQPLPVETVTPGKGFAERLQEAIKTGKPTASEEKS